MPKMTITENHVSSVESAGYKVSAFTVALLERFERGELNLSKAEINRLIVANALKENGPRAEMYMHRSQDGFILNPNGEDTLRINEPHVKQMILEHSRRVFELREQEDLCIDRHVSNMIEP